MTTTFALTIGGVAKQLRGNSLRIVKTANGRTVASFSVHSRNATYRPALDAEVIMTVNGTRVFGGLVERAPEKGLVGGARPNIETVVSAADFNAYPERRIILDGGYPAGMTLLQMLTDLVGWLTVYGVTLDAGQVTGPTFLEPMIFPVTKVSAALDFIVQLTGKYGEPFVWRIDANKVLRLFQPSTLAAPFDILTDAPGYVDGDITVDPTRDGYANRVYVMAAPKSEDGREESFTGDGTTDTFTLQYTPTEFRGYVTSDGVFETLNRTGDADAATWTYDATTNSITRNSGAPGSGVISTIGFDGTYAGRKMAQHASVFTDPWEKVVEVEDVDSDDTLQAIADAELAQSLLTSRTVRYRTWTHGVEPGQTQTFTVPARNLSADGIITDVVISDRVNRLVYDVTVIVGAQSNLGRTWRDVVKGWSENTSGGGVSVGAGGAPSTGPAPPDQSVQSNRNGVFYGKASFLFLADQNSVSAGNLSTITAGNAESCFVFAYDGHIED